jgi:DNA-binding transcriptional LysR family regulator
MMNARLFGIASPCLQGHVDPARQSPPHHVLEDWCPEFPGFYLYYPSRRQVPAGLRAFIEMVRKV